eukprot:gene2820-5543_t
MLIPILVILLLGNSVNALTSSRLGPTFSLINAKDDDNCTADGVCKLPKVISKKFEEPIEEKKSDDVTINSTIDAKELKQEIHDIPISVSPENVQELVKMGWTEEESFQALSINKNDMTAAAEYLENLEIIKENSKEIAKQGWRIEAAVEAMQASEGNTTRALELLQNEENAIQDQFETAVKGMVDNGWEEFIARQALLAQWSTDQSRANGKNVTVSAEDLAALRPTLKQTKETPTGKTATGKTAANKKGSSKDSSSPPPEPARPEDCIFEVTAATLQKIVFESPVPVLIDVYADWCGPCKQLGPILENAAIKSGGMFRLVKINSDKERLLAETLCVSGLPTVFSLTKGKLTDRFVGMLPQDDLQSFLIRAITGYGDRVQGAEVSEADLKELTEKLSMTKEKLKSLVAEALSLPGAFLEEGEGGGGVGGGGVLPSTGNKKYRVINDSGKNIKFQQEQTSDVYQKLKLKQSSAKATANKPTSTKPTVSVSTSTYVSDTPTATATPVTSTTTPTPSSLSDVSLDDMKGSLNRQIKAKKLKKENEDEENKSAATAKQVTSNEVTLGLQLEDGSVVQRAFKHSTKLRDAIDQLVSSTTSTGTSNVWMEGELRFPPPRRTLSRSSTFFDKTMKDIVENESKGTSISFSLKKSETSTSSTSDSVKKSETKSIKKSGFGGMFLKKENKNTAPKKDSNQRKGTHTLFSSGILSNAQKKNNEYFGEKNKQKKSAKKSTKKSSNADDNSATTSTTSTAGSYSSKKSKSKSTKNEKSKSDLSVSQ